MKFSYTLHDQKTELKCQIEHDQELTGSRDQTPYGPLKWPLDQSEITITFQQQIDLDTCHPDLLAVTYLTLVYPFLRERVEFPRGISSRLAQALRQFPLKRTINGRYQEIGFLTDIKPIDEQLMPWDEQGEQNEYGIAFGGGLDSSAIKVLYPEAWLLHDTQDKENETTRLWGGRKTKQGLRVGGDPKFIGVQTTTRKVHRGIGWTSWTSCLTLGLLMASELQLGVLMYGTNLGDFFRPAGRSGVEKYHRIYREPARSPWLDLFQAAGLRVFSPVLGLSALGTARLTVAGGLLKKACWCYQGKNNKACHHCPKCFRKEILLAAVGKGPLLPITRERSAVRKDGQMWPPSWRRYPDHRVLKMLNTFDYGPSLHRALVLLGEIDKLHPKTKKIRQLQRIINDRNRNEKIKEWLADGQTYYPLALSEKWISNQEDCSELEKRLSNWGFSPLDEKQTKFLNLWSLPKN